MGGGVQYSIYKLPDRIAEINAAVDQITSGLSAIAGTVKSIQKGVVTCTASANNPYADVTLSAVVIAKCVIHLYHSPETSGEAQGYTAALTTTTNLRIDGKAVTGHTAKVLWEVVEYN